MRRGAAGLIAKMRRARRGAILRANKLSQLSVRLYDVAEFVREIVLIARRAERDNRRPNGERRHRHHLTNEPIGPRKTRIEAENLAILVADRFEDLERFFGAQ